MVQSKFRPNHQPSQELALCTIQVPTFRQCALWPLSLLPELLTPKPLRAGANSNTQTSWRLQLHRVDLEDARHGFTFVLVVRVCNAVCACINTYHKYICHTTNVKDIDVCVGCVRVPYIKQCVTNDDTDLCGVWRM